MKKEIEISKLTKIMFTVNIIITITIFLFKYLFKLFSYYPTIITIFIVLDIIILLFGIFCNIMILVNKKYDNKNNIKFAIIYLIIYILLNTLVIYLVNKPISLKYKSIEQKLYNNCSKFKCDTFRTEVINNSDKKYIIDKTYFDYDDKENNIHIEIIYDKDNIKNITADIYSDKDMFSQLLIKQELDKYFNLYNITLSEDMIKSAFEERFNGSKKENDIEYRVKEIYKNKNLYKIKTTIFLTISS